MTTGADGLIGLARWAGQHGLALYAATLVLLLMATALAGRRWAPAAAGPGSGPGAPVWQPTAPAVASGLAVMALAVGLFGAIAWPLGASERLRAADLVLLQALQPTVTPAVRRLFAGLSHAADTATLTALGTLGALALVAGRQRLLAAAWVVAIAGNGWLNTSLKQAFGRLRPLPLDGLLPVSGLSFPSGHSSGAVVAYGMAAYLALRLLPPRWHLPALLLAVALAFSIGASRVILQAHFASDVLAGFASGSAWLALCITGLALLHRAGMARRKPTAP